MYATPTPDNLSAVDNTHSSAMKTAAYSALYTEVDGHMYTELRKDNSLSLDANPDANIKGLTGPR